MNTFTKSIAMAVMASAVTAVYAQPAEIPGRGPIPFNAIDLDGNGTISAQEFDTVHQQRMSARAAEGRPMRGMANGHSYTDFDTDDNGQLTPDELAAGQHVQMQKRQAMGMGQGQGQGMGRGRNMPAFADFDLDADGYLVEDEFYEARDLRVSERAKQGYQMRGLANAPSFTNIDTDGDNRVSQQEFAAHQAQHRQDNRHHN